MYICAVRRVTARRWLWLTSAFRRWCYGACAPAFRPTDSSQRRTRTYYEQMYVWMPWIRIYLEGRCSLNTYIHTHVHQPALCDGVLEGIKAAVGESWSREQLYDAVDLGSYDGSSMETERVICSSYMCICLFVYIYSTYCMCAFIFSI